MCIIIFKGDPKVSDEGIILKSVLNEIALHFYNTTSFEKVALNPIIYGNIYGNIRRNIIYIVVLPPLKIQRCYTISKIMKLRKTLTSFMNNLMIAGVNIQYA